MRIKTGNCLNLVEGNDRTLRESTEFRLRQIAVLFLNRFEFVDKVHGAAMLAPNGAESLGSYFSDE